MRFFNSPRRLLQVRIALAGVLLLACATAASAYTLVFRDGRRVEVPATFTVTQTSLTYEAAPGINRTVQMILIDVAATERANNEGPGSLLRHVEQESASTPAATIGRARATLTNRDLERVQQRRLESEQAYDKRRIELGLPTLAETRRRQAEEEQGTLAMIRERGLAQRASEAYWRDRASALREEIVAADAEINYLRSRLSDYPSFPLATQSLVTGVLPLLPSGNRSGAITPRFNSPRTYVAPPASPQFGGRAVLNGSPVRGQVLMNSPRGTFHSARPFGRIGFPAAAYYPFINARPFDFVEGSYERTGLAERLTDLQLRRAGLAARWRQLEDEAREAQVPQVWLEP